jgi:hypothetical protein
MAVKVYHAKETLQYFILAEWLAAGANPVAEILWPKNSKVVTAKTHFYKLTGSPLAAKVAKNLPRC